MNNIMAENNNAAALVDIYTAIRCVSKGCVARSKETTIRPTSLNWLFFDKWIGLVEQDDLIRNYKEEKFNIYKPNNNEN